VARTIDIFFSLNAALYQESDRIHERINILAAL